MFDITNYYELKIDAKESGKGYKYFACFIDANCQKVEQEISREVAQAMFVDFVRKERNLLRWDQRHQEHSDLTEKSFNRRVLYPPEHIEEQILKKILHEQLHLAIETLSEKQKRRVKMYFFNKFTLEKIADIEGCSVHSVYATIERSKEKIKKILFLM